jgi:(p)ppGpp synthase/HD superfamily hydrolase
VIELAEQIAREAHAGQFRRDGVTPYIEHPKAVANRLSHDSEEVISTAWLHDVLEDTRETAESLRDWGMPEVVVEAVVAMTKRDGETYHEYLERVKRNSIARKVKVADMLHNLSDNPTGSQVSKYSRGLLRLLH